ncbi:MAG TPA: HD domain-containing protein [Longimicrobium sp.]|nr:HD domain-containing protein [Longimicrobium sp.]
MTIAGMAFSGLWNPQTNGTQVIASINGLIYSGGKTQSYGLAQTMTVQNAWTAPAAQLALRPTRGPAARRGLSYFRMMGFVRMDGTEVLSRADVLARTEAHVRQAMTGEGSGHDWWHVHRVRQTALRLAREEGADAYVVELAALLHDIADHKFHGGDETAGPRAARAWLEPLGVEPEVTGHVASIIAALSFKGAGVNTPMETPEGRVVQDADRLDALGAVGIARTFAYGGSRGREMHDPGVAPEAHGSFAAYKASTGPTINHFHEKLLLLRERMNTASARRIAEGRHRFMERFLARFHAEWEGQDGMEDDGDD